MSRKYEPGGRIDGETRKAYEAFVIYRSEKSLSKTMEKLREKYGKLTGKSIRQLEDWCSKYRWVERLQEWEDYLDAKARDEMVKKRRKWAQEEEQICSTVMSRGLAALKSKNPEDMTFSEILSYLREGMDRRRRLCGESDKISEIRFQNEDSDRYEKNMIDAIRNMSDEELERQIGRVDKILDVIEGGEIEKGSSGEFSDMESKESGS